MTRRTTVTTAGMRLTRGTQPIKGRMAMLRESNRAVARATGRTEHYIGRVVNGTEIPSAALRAELVDYLGVPEAQLFDNSDPAA